MEDYEEEKPGFPLGWLILTVLVGLIAAGAVGFAAVGSESAGVLASQVAACPVIQGR